MKTISLPADSPLLNDNFIFGVATSSFQIEGAADTRLPCIWDSFCEREGAIQDGSDGLIACDHFHLWKADIDLVASLGVDAYRFSISWPRTINRDGTLNQDGADFYIKLIDYAASQGLKAFATLYHWDLPQHHEDQGGWLNRETAFAFRDYAEKITRALGDRVASWATLNEPFCAAYLGYELGVHAPGKTGRKNGRQAAHNMLLAHGLAMEVLRTNCPDAENGLVLNLSPCYPVSSSEADVAAARRASQYLFEWFLSPVLKGCYPDVINDLAAADRPVIEDGDFDIISTPIDWIGLNYYTRDLYQAHDDELFDKVDGDEHPLTAMGWEVYPPGLTDIIMQMHDNYDLPPLYVAENGAAMPDKIISGAVNDTDRIDYLHRHLNALDIAARQGVDVRGYFAWSLMDNFEWAEGYEKRFGIVYVDYETQKRTIKASGLAYRDFLIGRNERFNKATGS